jgi:hypothetical protein
MFKSISMLVAATVVSFSAVASPADKAVIGETSWEHGGGCRKSSLPFQCCHEDKRTGIVHCH